MTGCRLRQPVPQRPVAPVVFRVGQTCGAADCAIFAGTVFQRADGAFRTFVQRTFVVAAFLTGLKQFKRTALTAGRTDFGSAVANQISAAFGRFPFIFQGSAAVAGLAVDFVAFFGGFFIGIVVTAAGVAYAVAVGSVMGAKRIGVENFAFAAICNITRVGTCFGAVFAAGGKIAAVVRAELVGISGRRA